MCHRERELEREKKKEKERKTVRGLAEWAEKQINGGFRRTEAQDGQEGSLSSALALCCVVKYTAVC